MLGRGDFKIMTTINSDKKSEEKKAKDTFTRAFRFICQLNLQDHSVDEQREQLELITEMKQAAKSVSIDNDRLAHIARRIDTVKSEEQPAVGYPGLKQRIFIKDVCINLLEQSKCIVCEGYRPGKPHPIYAHSVCWCGLSDSQKINIARMLSDWKGTANERY